MISENRFAIVSPITVFVPAIALAVLAIGLNLFTDGIAKSLDVQRSVSLEWLLDEHR